MALEPVKTDKGGLATAVVGNTNTEKESPGKKPKTTAKKERGLPRQLKKKSPPRILVDLTAEQKRKLDKMVTDKNTTIKDFVLWKCGLLDID